MPGRRPPRVKRPTSTYTLDVQVGDRWVRQCEIEATSHADAFRWASMCLKPEHYDKPIRILPLSPPAPGGDGLA